MRDSLEELRVQIDQVDRSMRLLFLRRMALVKEVGALKASLGKAVYDPDREAAILKSGAEEVPDALRAYYGFFQKELMALSRAYQEALAKEKGGEESLDA